MADLYARLDPDTDYVHVGSSDNYPLPDDVWKMLHRYGGQYHPEHPHEQRLTKPQATRAVERLHRDGHRVTKTTGPHGNADSRAARSRRGPLECVTCGAAYPVTKTTVPGELCSQATKHGHDPHPLELTGPPA